MTDYAGSVAIRAEQPGDAAPIRETIIAAFGQSAEADLVTALAAAR